MTALQLNAELYRAMGEIADDETLMKTFFCRKACGKGKRLYFCSVKDEADHRKYPIHRTLTFKYLRPLLLGSGRLYFRRDGMKSYRLSKLVLHDVQIHHSAINDEFIVVIPNTV